jgi:hypothetical protein
MPPRGSKDARDVMLFTLVMLVIIVVVFFMAGYLLGRSII